MNKYSDGYQAGMADVANKILDEGLAAGVTWVIDNCTDRDLSDRLRALAEPKDEVCVYCREAIERRDGEVVSKYGNDSQCDSSPNSNHRFQ